MSAQSVVVRVELPPGISEASRESAERDAREAAILSLWQRGEITTRVAARELALEYHQFLDLLDARGIPVEGEEPDLDAIAAARRKLGGPVE